MTGVSGWEVSRNFKLISAPPCSEFAPFVKMIHVAAAAAAATHLVRSFSPYWFGRKEGRKGRESQKDHAAR